MRAEEDVTPRPGDCIRVRFLRGKRFRVKEVTSVSIVDCFELEGRVRGKMRSFKASDVVVVKAETIPEKRRVG